MTLQCFINVKIPAILTRLWLCSALLKHVCTDYLVKFKIFQQSLKKSPTLSTLYLLYYANKVSDTFRVRSDLVLCTLFLKVLFTKIGKCVLGMIISILCAINYSPVWKTKQKTKQNKTKQTNKHLLFFKIRCKIWVWNQSHLSTYKHLNIVKISTQKLHPSISTIKDKHLPKPNLPYPLPKRRIGLKWEKQERQDTHFPL